MLASNQVGKSGSRKFGKILVATQTFFSKLFILDKSTPMTDIYIYIYIYCIRIYLTCNKRDEYLIKLLKHIATFSFSFLFFFGEIKNLHVFFVTCGFRSEFL